MGTLTSSLFRVTMGWIRTLIQEIWTTVSQTNHETLISWIGGHWKMLALILCIIGLAADLAVYLFRWQPYRVWRSSFRRRKLRKEEAEEAAEADPAEEPDPSGAQEYMDYPEEEDLRGRIPERWDEDESAEAPEEERSREPAAMARERAFLRDEESERDSKGRGEAYDRRAYVPEEAYGWQGENRVRPNVPMDSPYRRPAAVEVSRAEPEGTTARFEQAIRPRKRRRVREFLSDSENAEYVPPDQLIDRREAYRRPVYPSSWQMDEEDE